MTRWLREPLLHFLSIGVALFGLYAWLGERSDEAGLAGGEIVVTQGRLWSLAETFSRQWSRPPTEDEMAALVREFVREEVMAREALALGLDRDDTIVRRRLAQKMEFLADDLATTADPTDEQLRAYLAARQGTFRLDARFTFSQVFLDRGRRGPSLETDAARLLARLEGTDPLRDLGALGDSRMLEPHQAAVTRHDVEGQFGAAFAARLEELPLGRWQGPIESGYGVHLVRVEERIPGRVPPLEEVRDAVLREWSAAKRVEMRETQLQALLARYTVTVEKATAAGQQVAEVKR